MNKQDRSETHRQFLLGFFDPDSGYAERELNGVWLIKQWDGTKKRWVVYLYGQESYANYTAGRAKWQAAKQQSLLDSGESHLNAIFNEKSPPRSE